MWFSKTSDCAFYHLTRLYSPCHVFRRKYKKIAWNEVGRKKDWEQETWYWKCSESIKSFPGISEFDRGICWRETLLSLSKIKNLLVSCRMFRKIEGKEGFTVAGLIKYVLRRCKQSSGVVEASNQLGRCATGTISLWSCLSQWINAAAEECVLPAAGGSD